MVKVYLGLGSNKGDRLQFLKSALTEIACLEHTKIEKVSDVYETEPVGKKDQDEFLNAIARIETTVDAKELLRALKAIERKLGRKETVRWGPREIDIDILYYDSSIREDESLHIPHPEIANRRFVLIPLSEMAPDLVDPVRKLSTLDLLRFCPDTSSVRRTKYDLGTTE